MAPLITVFPNTWSATTPPRLPSQGSGTIEAPALTVSEASCGTRTTWTEREESYALRSPEAQPLKLSWMVFPATLATVTSS